MGDRADIIRQMHAAVRGDPARYRDLRAGDALPRHPDGGRSPAVHGKVRAKALVDEMRGTFCAIVETPDGAAYRVPLDARAADDCQAGDFVELRSVAKPRHRPEDREIEALARASGRRCVDRRRNRLRPDPHRHHKHETDDTPRHRPKFHR